MEKLCLPQIYLYTMHLKNRRAQRFAGTGLRESAASRRSARNKSETRVENGSGGLASRTGGLRRFSSSRISFRVGYFSSRRFIRITWLVHKRAGFWRRARVTDSRVNDRHRNRQVLITGRSTRSLFGLAFPDNVGHHGRG